MIDTKWSVIFRSFSKLTISKCSYFTLFVVKLSTLRVDFLQPLIVDLFRIFLSQVKTYLCLHNQYQGDRIWVQSWPQMTNLGLFQIRFQYILARWNMIWKSPRFVPFGLNLTHFGPKSDQHTVMAWPFDLHISIRICDTCNYSPQYRYISLDLSWSHTYRTTCDKVQGLHDAVITWILVNNCLWCSKLICAKS